MRRVEALRDALCAARAPGCLRCRRAPGARTATELQGGGISGLRLALDAQAGAR